jgi:hypothetical protein
MYLKMKNIPMGMYDHPTVLALAFPPTTTNMAPRMNISRPPSRRITKPAAL